MILIYSTQIADSRLVKLSTTGKVHIAVGQNTLCEYKFRGREDSYAVLLDDHFCKRCMYSDALMIDVDVCTPV
jgi:hypothetical protein